MEREFILESRINELEEQVAQLKYENARLKCHLLALASENNIKLSFDVLTYLKQPSSTLKIDEEEE